MSNKVDFDMPVPQVFLEGKADMELVRRSVQKAEELGFHSLWVQDQVHGFVPLFESVTLLCYAAALSTRVKLGVSVIVFPVRNPVLLAKQLGSLDQMSNGRLIVGIGLGPPLESEDFYVTMGVQSRERVRRFNEGLGIMKVLWTEPKIDHHGEFFTLLNASMEPKPVQKLHPPIWIGGQHPNALRRAVRLGDGYTSAGPTPISDYKGHVALVRQYLEEDNRDPSGFPISRRLYVAIHDDERVAKKTLDDWFAKRYGWILKNRPNMVEEICVWGTAQQCVDGLADVISGGAELLILNPIGDYLEQMEDFAQNVIPHLQ